MDENVIDEFLESILSALASAETQSAALLQVLRETKNVSEEQLTKAMDQASNATEIKMRATRLRLKRILTAAISELEKQQTKKEDKVEPEKKKPEQDDSGKAAEQDFTKQESHQQEAKKPEEAPTQREQEATPQEASSSESAPKQESAEEKPEEHETREAGPKKRPPESQPKTEKPPDQASG